LDDLYYFRPDWIEQTDRQLNVDICVYGASSAGVIAAITAAQAGKTVALLQPGKFIGGLTTGGLGWTDHGKAGVIGGMARDFYRRCGKHYGKAEEWYFEPKVAQHVFDDWLSAAGIVPVLCQYLSKAEVQGGQIQRIHCLGGLSVTARAFIDATYEGDLIAQAGVQFHTGRESNKTFGETLNGVQVHEHHQFVPSEIDPWVIPGDRSSGLLPHVEAVDQTRHIGDGDHRIQAYNFRICMTDDPQLKIDWEKPADFDPREYLLAARWFSGKKDAWNDQLRPGPSLDKFDILPNRTPGGFRKTDTNNHGPVSSDFIGANWAWPEGSYDARERIFQQHVSWQKGFYWFMANSAAIPETYRSLYRQWGLSPDEFTSTGGWSHTLYIREARRMIGDYVATEHDCMHTRQCDDPVGMGSYNLDSHNCTRFVNSDGFVMNDGDVQAPPAGPYRISYRSIIPPRGSISNLLVPVCCSASHIAYGSVRMEPVFMILGQSAALAASLAIDRGAAVQAVPYSALRSQLDRAGQVLDT